MIIDKAKQQSLLSILNHLFFPEKTTYQNHIKHAPNISHILSTNTRVYQSVVICTVYKSNMLTNISRAAANESVTIWHEDLSRTSIGPVCTIVRCEATKTAWHGDAFRITGHLCGGLPLPHKEMSPLTYSDMMTSSNGNLFRVTGHLCWEFIGHPLIPHTKASDAELWCFLSSVPEYTVE